MRHFCKPQRTLRKRKDRKDIFILISTPFASALRPLRLKNYSQTAVKIPRINKSQFVIRYSFFVIRNFKILFNPIKFYPSILRPTLRGLIWSNRIFGSKTLCCYPVWCNSLSYQILFNRIRPAL